jgi:hypothetical protein
MYSITNLIFFNLSILILCFLFARIHKFDFLKILFLSIIIACYFGFRPLNVGVDTENYYTYYLNSLSGIELGFTFLNRIIFTIFGDDHRIYFSIINFIMIMNLLIASKLIVKYPIYIYTAWIIVSLPYSILMQINIIRQGLALSFFVLGFSLILKRKFVLGIIVFLISISLHTSIVIYIVSFLITFFLDIKKDKKVIILIIFSIFSLTGIPYHFINSLGIPYIESRFLRYFSSINNLPFFMKISFYIFFYIIFDYFMIEKDLSEKRISLLYFFIVSPALFILQNDLTSVRFLLGLDFIFSLFLLSKATHYKNKDYLVASFLVIFLVFLFSIYSQAFRINFLY